ncbi:MAG TPA: bifunctional adenosylcobinamide kinase/adenosylcobinamide-phosphate guanylyltransferase [Syntrophales bacterium]|nr:bifunctional adenosylcobinamide kinase/adenosylcobinamide-phosphate guanylyltransferase [Syntrophales bacterium]
MARIILVTGGGRSGKSTFAQRMAESMADSRVYIATCPVIDDEMAERVRKHREARKAGRWDTMEEPLALADALREEKHDICLVDCLTLWVNNVVYEAEKKGRAVTEEDIALLCDGILEACRRRAGTVIFVTNEVGMGIIPDSPLARRYRDLAGRCNQVIARQAETVILMVCGIPVAIKGSL